MQVCKFKGKSLPGSISLLVLFFPQPPPFIERELRWWQPCAWRPGTRWAETPSDPSRNLISVKWEIRGSILAKALEPKQMPLFILTAGLDARGESWWWQTETPGCRKQWLEMARESRNQKYSLMHCQDLCWAGGPPGSVGTPTEGSVRYGTQADGGDIQCLVGVFKINKVARFLGGRTRRMVRGRKEGAYTICLPKRERSWGFRISDKRIGSGRARECLSLSLFFF